MALQWERRRSPAAVISAAGVVGLVVTALVLLAATGQPWLGLVLASSGSRIIVAEARGPGAQIPPGTVVTHIAGNAADVELLPIDLATEPDGAMGTYETYDTFLDRQDLLARIQRGKDVTFTDAGGRFYPVTPTSSRPLRSLPASFWVQLVVGVVAWMISAGIFAFRSGEASARYLLLSGAATLTFAPLAAVYSTRELALPALLFRWLNDLNFLGGSLFTASFVALLLNYPRRIGPRWLGVAIVAAYVGWFVLQQAGVFASMTFARRFLVVLGVGTTFVLAGAHWFGTRRDPARRAALQWFLLSWMLGTSLFVLFILLPQMFGVDTSPLQGYAFGLFLLVYCGLAFGIMRYRLFDLGEWWGRAMVWTLSILFLVLLDFLFLLGLQLSSNVSLGLALLISGLLWLPLRAFVWNRILKGPAQIGGSLFRQVVDVALAPSAPSQEALWRALLQQTFAPLRMETSQEVADSTIEADGLALAIPSVAAVAPLRLEYGDGGRRLFTPRDAALADELTAMLRHTVESRSAYESGVAEERARIARDMHDNIGAQLLTALHSRESDRKDAMIRETLTDLRDIINNASRPTLPFDEALADLRLETAERLSAANISLEWALEVDGAPELAPNAAHMLRSVVREAASNIIKHSAASKARIGIRFEEGLLTLAIEDDGGAFDPGPISGNGLANIRSRISAHQGTVQFRSDGNGMLVAATIPLSNGRADEPRPDR